MIMKVKMRLTAIFMAILMVVSMNGAVLAQDSGQMTEPAQTQEAPANLTAAPDQTVEQPSAWAAEGVSWSAIYGLVSSDMLTNYRSDVTRTELYAAACNLYVRMTGKTIVPAEKSPFADTDLPVARAAYAIGILDGEGDFEPEKAASRKEMAEVIYKTLEVSGLELDLDGPDDNIEDAVRFFAEEGLLKGRGGNDLYLDSPCSRQELMVFLHRVYEHTAYETGNYSKGLFWKASDEDSTIYLLGSIHVADQSLYPLSKDILNAFDSSDILVLEADLSRLQEDMIYMQQKIFYEGDETLDKNISKELYDRFVKLVEPLGLTPEVYNKFKPWYAAMLAQNILVGNTGETGGTGGASDNSTGEADGTDSGTGSTGSAYSGDLGIDMYFTSKAVNTKAIAEIEGLKFQVDMFDSFSNEIQAWYLESTLPPSVDDAGADSSAEGTADTGDAASEADTAGGTDSASHSINAFALMLSAWESGDAELIAMMVRSTYTDDPKAIEFNNIFWNTRNNHMYEKAVEFLADPEGRTYFIVVGAGHMQGDTGIITQLIKNGYNVERILN